MSHERDRLADRFRGAMLGVAIGDALGAPVERGDRDPAAVRTWAHEIADGLQTGEDTHMTLATARSLLACRDLDTDAMASALAQQYAREPWKEATGSWRVFDGMRTGERWERLSEELFGGTGSFGNGAAMRVTPLGLLYVGRPAMAAERARDAARITHAHPIGQDGAGLQAAAVAVLLGATTFDAKNLMAQMKEHAVTQSARIDVSTARDRLAVSRIAVAQAQRAFDIEREKLTIGRGTTTDVLDAHAALVQAEAAHFGNLTMLSIAYARLTFALGEPVR